MAANVRVRVVSYPVRVHTSLRRTAERATADTVRRLQKITPVGPGGGPHMRDLIDGRLTSGNNQQARARFTVNDKPGKVAMREYGGEIHPKPGRPLVFRSQRTGQWVTIKYPRFVRQRPGGYSQGFRPWLRRIPELFSAAMEARARGLANIQPPRNRRR